MPPSPSLQAINHIVVIYEENHSFDNLFGTWPGVNGLANADAAHTTQVGQNGAAYACLPQNDASLTSPVPLATSCTDASLPAGLQQSAFTNRPFSIDTYIPATATTCPGGTAGGCTRDLIHSFYTEQYQINGGAMNRYVAGSDAIGLTMGQYDTTKLPIYKYLTGPGAPRYVIADNFFQGAFGGSYLNHQWLVAARTPTFANADHSGTASDLHSVLPADGNPVATPLHTAPGGKNGVLTVDTNPDGSCKQATTTPCGDYAVNTIQPPYQPTGGGTTLPPLTYPNIGDLLSTANVDWAWYSGGWSNANGNVGAPGWTNGNGPTCSDPNVHGGATYPYCADSLFQYHHQPFNYFAAYAPGTATRTAHLRDEQEFLTAARNGTLKPVSFIKPQGRENEHPGYSSTPLSQAHLVETIKAIQNGPDGKDTMIIVTYDEFGGAWDHVSPPTGPGVSDKFGPGTRIPAIVISPLLAVTGVDHTQYDTTSILATIEARFGLAPLTTRDAAVNSFASDFVPAGASKFVPVTPTRILDTRPGTRVGFTGDKPGASANVRVQVVGAAGVPTGATAAVVNLTATEPDAAGFVQAFPTGAGTPGASSNLNVERAGQTVPNSALVPIGSDGSITVHVQSPTHLIVDLSGYYVGSSAAEKGGRLVPVTPARVFDTRPDSAIGFSGAKPGPASTTTVPIAGLGGVPSAGVAAAVLNVTATQATGAGFVQLAPAGQLVPGASSNLNLDRAGQTVANQVIVPLGADGAVAVYSQAGAHLVIDVSGYITSGAATSSTSGLFVPLTPGRVLDTRVGSAVGYTGPTPGATARVSVAVAGKVGLPSSSIGAVAANLTITSAAGPGFVQAAPAGSLTPGASSSLNAETAGQTIANAAIIPVSKTGFELYTQSGGELIADVAGWFTP